MQWVVLVDIVSRRLRVLYHCQLVIFYLHRKTYITAPALPSQLGMECVLHAVPQRPLDPQFSPHLVYPSARAWQCRNLHHGFSRVTLTLRSFVGHVSIPSLASIRVQRCMAYIISPPYPLPKHLLSTRLKRQFRPTQSASSPSPIR